MNIRIRTKLLIFCFTLIFLTTLSVSTAYYRLIKRNKEQESQQQIQVAFDIIWDDLTRRLQEHTQRMQDFLLQDQDTLYLVARMYGGTEAKTASIDRDFVTRRLVNLIQFASLDRVALYGLNKVSLAQYQRPFEQEPDHEKRRHKETSADGQHASVEATPGLPIKFDRNIPESVSASLFREEQRLGIRILLPLSQNGDISGVLLGDVWLTPLMVNRYASLSQTAINFFAGQKLSIGTLTDEAALAEDTLQQSVACANVTSQKHGLTYFTMKFRKDDYEQGRCVLQDSDKQPIGAITVNVSLAATHKALARIFSMVFVIAAGVSVLAVGLTVLFSRSSLHSLHATVRVIGLAADGDLRQSAPVVTHDEIGLLATKLNQMIAQLRIISGQVQTSSSTVNGTADTILHEMETLVRHMEQQSVSVGNTTAAVENINQFIETVARKNEDSLSAASEVSASLLEMAANIEEISSSTGSLSQDLSKISAAIEQMNSAVKQIAGNTEHLARIAKQTDTDVQQIDLSFHNVAQNAAQTKNLAQETKEAVMIGQTSVDTAIQGINELKAVVAQTAVIIQEVNAWGERVSSIVNIVDEIAEQTSLLALNASIISAQAGAYGKGFAVVSDEIKTLAIRTKGSTKEIRALISDVQKKMGESVKQMEYGRQKADRGVQLAQAVKEALNTILMRAVDASQGAENTVEVLQQIAGCSGNIRASMSNVTDMVGQIITAIQQEEENVEQVVVTVEDISKKAILLNRASLEQNQSVEQIAQNLEYVISQFDEINTQTHSLKSNSQQIVEAMHTIATIAERISGDTDKISGETVKQLLQQSETLHHAIKIFKIA
ncbi:methyl-accepting chemotaxis sensory transducer [Candidatus Moduliflexus flocculans]|uniref:Methyl-accepting chemotaxis sensory transducer n=1 Tax=Candidatus Moduliflexus flocculans TaxID=1499966 RepID=A0A081BSH7_9BACT|nr:methyl-accepting chemotaxis sensory transducer [Candidatus Moduliflexus flocculans]